MKTKTSAVHASLAGNYFRKAGEYRDSMNQRVAQTQTYAFFAFVCGSSSIHGILCLDVNIMVDVPMLRTAE